MLRFARRRTFRSMANPYSPSVLDLGLGGGEGDLLRDQVDDEETRKKKKLLQLNGGEGGPQQAVSALGPAAMSLLGAFRG